MNKSLNLLDAWAFAEATGALLTTVAGGRPAGKAGFWTAEGGGGSAIDARVACMACWMAEDGAEDWTAGTEETAAEPSSVLLQ